MAGETARAFAHGGDGIVTDHPALRGHALDVARGPAGVTGLWWGETLFARAGAVPPPASPERLRALAGVYLNRDPWVGAAVVLVRGDRLVLEGGDPLVERGDYWTLEADAGGVERFRFEAPLAGRPTRLNVSGADLIRLTV
jgi:hypothetical protein